VERIAEYARKLNIVLDDHQTALFVRYGTLLLEYNKVMNLTAITEPGDIALKHFADSITVLPMMEKVLGKDLAGLRLADVGTGAGFPGIPLKIVSRGLDLTLIDALRKRITFLETVCAELGLDDVHTIHARAEDAGNDRMLRERFDVAIARAVAPMPILCEYCLPLVKVGGIFAAMKSDVREDLASAEYAIGRLGGVVEEFFAYPLPDSDVFRTLVVIRKKVPTPAQYPRKAGKPEKEPLQPTNPKPRKKEANP
jgi:16S rRNA (guanine527-N7)-methyltransferase